MISWNYLSQFNEKNPPQETLYRKKEIQDKYETFRDSLDIPIADYLHSTLFSDQNYRDYNLRLNDFPYNMEETISHYILWINPTSKSLPVKSIIQSKFKNFIYFMNVPKNRSVMEIPHYHIFTKKSNN
jgi:hypothetical protein